MVTASAVVSVLTAPASVSLSVGRTCDACLLDSNNSLLARRLAQAIKRKAIMRCQIKLDQVPVVLETLLMAVEQVDLLCQEQAPQRSKVHPEFAPLSLAPNRQKHRARVRG